MAALRTLRDRAVEFESAHHDKRMALLRRLWVSEI